MSSKGQTSIRNFFVGDHARHTEAPAAKKAKPVVPDMNDELKLSALSFAGDQSKKLTGSSTFRLMYKSLLLLTITMSRMDFAFLENGEQGRPFTMIDWEH